MNPVGHELADADLEDLLVNGRHLVLRDEAGVADSWKLVRASVGDALERVAGRTARQIVDRNGLGRLHDVLPAEKIGALRDEAMPAIRGELLELTVRVGREVLGIKGDFFVDDYTILRVNFPYEVALQAPKDAENPGIGRLSKTAAQDQSRAKAVDPVYNPRGYHRDQPPAAWAHGPHLDTWTGHSRDGVNLWWAISEVVAENSMFFYPELFGVPLAPDPESLYLRAGQPLPRPVPMPLRAGELLVFNPEVLHGTHLNVSGQTRVAASTRINASAPKFDPTCFYAREFWHSSADIEARRHEDIIRFARGQNLAEAEARDPALENDATRIDLLAELSSRQWTDVCSSADLEPKAKLVVEGTDGQPRLIVVRTAHGLRAFGALCPHLGTCLEDGFHDDEAIHCPSHAMRFSLATGQSSSNILSVPVAHARDHGGRIQLRLS